MSASCFRQSLPPRCASRKALWKKLDYDGNGHLSLGELTTGMRQEYPDLNALHHRTKAGAVGGALTSKEGRGRLQGAGRILARAHHAADCDHDGLVSRHELHGSVWCVRCNAAHTCKHAARAGGVERGGGGVGPGWA